MAGESGVVAVLCQGCGRTMAAPREHLGRTGKCRSCGGAVPIVELAKPDATTLPGQSHPKPPSPSPSPPPLATPSSSRPRFDYEWLYALLTAILSLTAVLGFAGSFFNSRTDANAMLLYIKQGIFLLVFTVSIASIRDAIEAKAPGPD